jgi:hypothetical protein
VPVRGIVFRRTGGKSPLPGTELEFAAVHDAAELEASLAMLMAVRGLVKQCNSEGRQDGYRCEPASRPSLTNLQPKLTASVVVASSGLLELGEVTTSPTRRGPQCIAKCMSAKARRAVCLAG